MYIYIYSDFNATFSGSILKCSVFPIAFSGFPFQVSTILISGRCRTSTNKGSKATKATKVVMSNKGMQTSQLAVAFGTGRFNGHLDTQGIGTFEKKENGTQAPVISPKPMTAHRGARRGSAGRPRSGRGTRSSPASARRWRWDRDRCPGCFPENEVGDAVFPTSSSLFFGAP